MKRAIVSILVIAAASLVACSNDALSSSRTEGQVVDAELSGSVERGAALFRVGKGDDSPPCSACHKVSAEGAGLVLGPVLEDIAVTGASRVEGMSAEEYIRDSVLHPENFVVPGFRVSMYPDYAKHLSEQDIADLIAYLMTL